MVGAFSVGLGSGTAPNQALQRTGGQRRVAAHRLRHRFGVVLPPPLSFFVRGLFYDIAALTLQLS